MPIGERGEILSGGQLRRGDRPRAFVDPLVPSSMSPLEQHGLPERGRPAARLRGLRQPQDGHPRQQLHLLLTWFDRGLIVLDQGQIRRRRP